MYSVDRFCFLVGCGCVFSDRALKEIKDLVCVNVSTLISLALHIRICLSFASVLCNVVALKTFIA